MPGRKLGQRPAFFALLWLCLASLWVGACDSRPDGIALGEGLRLHEVAVADLPGWQEDILGAVRPAFDRTCQRLLKLATDTPLAPRRLDHRAGDWQGPCRDLTGVEPSDDAALRAFLQSRFVAYQVAGEAGAQGLFTGYYEAEVRGAEQPGGAYQTAVYRRPADLLTANLGAFSSNLPEKRLIGRVVENAFVPYFTRAEIDSGELAGRGLELLWLDDPIDAFFLHVQGSGRVLMADGSVERIGFAGSNGHPFFAIGRALIESGEVSRKGASMQVIRDWLRAHPEEARSLMQQNARFIFFDRILGPGPIGSEGVALTPGRSLAVDTAYLPLGAPVWLDTTWPGSERPLQRLMMAQDSGNAIRGAVRGDFYWGSGEAALAYAGGMKQAGRYYLLLPRSLAGRLRPSS